MAQAVRVSGLYEAEVAVPDQSNSARVQGVVNALRSVIIKLTGDRAAPEKPDAGLILRSAERYLLQYRYQEAGSSADPAAASASPELRLWAQFSQGALDRDLRSAGLSLWGAERPSTLAWVAVNDGSGWRWAGGEDGAGWFQSQVEVHASRRGLGVIFPLHDLDDDARLAASAVGDADIAAIRQASERYQPNTVLAVAIDVSAPDNGRARWSLLSGSEPESWNTEGGQSEEFVRAGMDTLADRLSLRYAAARASAEQGVVTVNVKAVNSATGYARALNYLQGMNSVTAVQVTEVAGDTVTFALSVYGGADVVRQAIALGRVLEPASGSDNTYRLSP